MQRIPLAIPQRQPAQQCSRSPTFERRLDDPHLRSLLLSALADGSGRKAACAYARLSYNAFVNYLELDSDFEEQVLHAEGKRAVDAVARIVSDLDWHALAWFLERKYPDEWGRSSTLALTGKDGGPIQLQDIPFDLSRLTDQEYVEVKRLVAKIDGRVCVVEVQEPPKPREVLKFHADANGTPVGGNGNGTTQ